MSACARWPRYVVQWPRRDGITGNMHQCGNLYGLHLPNVIAHIRSTVHFTLFAMYQCNCCIRCHADEVGGKPAHQKPLYQSLRYKNQMRHTSKFGQYIAMTLSERRIIINTLLTFSMTNCKINPKTPKPQNPIH